MQPNQYRHMSRATKPVDLSFLVGATVTRVYVDQCAAGMLLDLGAPVATYDWRVEQPFQLRTAEQNHEPDPESARSILPFLSVLGRAIEKAEAHLEGRIRFELSGGIVIESGSDQSFEAWQLAGPKGFLLVCMPGGGLAT